MQCAKPCDRATVLGQIREQWDSEEAFDHFVQTELPVVLERSKRRYSRQLLRTMFDAFDLAFVSLDFIDRCRVSVAVHPTHGERLFRVIDRELTLGLIVDCHIGERPHSSLVFLAP